MSDQSRLSVNVNAVAMLRNRRDLPWPSVVDMSRIALQAGAKGITIHPRPDERHIRKTDVADLTALINDEFPDKELCLEGYPSPDFLDLVEKHRPHQVLYVPDDPAQLTSDHGWNLARDSQIISAVTRQTKQWNVRVSLFVNADPEAPELAAQLGAERIEIYTGPYGACYDDEKAAERERARVVATGKAAHKAGLGVNAGHDLTLLNLPPLVAEMPFLREVSIGHGFTADALIYGFAETVRLYRVALGELPA
ncbi:pyridoxine 5'-phosphate synthase [Rhizobiales bacterium]|uniref:pyridoxine 5'-phosphate synthase n=1 Tax=Hongsoonwoonella zoysiae TaxID=2821844 RepID=UPI00156093CD|nr:pyridoxine 5'-phosphate synthase [Hongsoonwoonella zoysiae]NRG17924.1 pyridoxine 5'-phosphate synthase [Hongsoonwoonella zoysiae]